jgi:hypothetical protein
MSSISLEAMHLLKPIRPVSGGVKCVSRFNFLADIIVKMCSNNTVIVTQEESVVCNKPISLEGLTHCNHEEADTRIFLHSKHVAADGNNTIIINYWWALTEFSKNSRRLRAYISWLPCTLFPFTTNADTSQPGKA